MSYCCKRRPSKEYQVWSIPSNSLFFKTPRYFRATAKTTESPCIGIFCLGKVLNKFNKGGKGVDGLSFKS